MNERSYVLCADGPGYISNATENANACTYRTVSGIHIYAGSPEKVSAQSVPGTITEFSSSAER